MNIRKKLYFPSLVIVFAALLLTSIAGIVYRIVPSLSPQAAIGGVIFTVKSFDNRKPIDGAVVYIPELHSDYRTDSRGCTEPINVFFKGEKSKLLSAVVFKDGYVDFVLLSLRVEPGKIRETPTIHLETATENSPAYHASSDAAKDEWIKEIIEEAKNKMPAT